MIILGIGLLILLALITLKPQKLSAQSTSEDADKIRNSRLYVLLLTIAGFAVGTQVFGTELDDDLIEKTFSTGAALIAEIAALIVYWNEKKAA